MTEIPLTESQQVEHMLARRLYRQFCEHRDKEMMSPPFVPEWAYAYAQLAVTYLGYDGEAIDRLKGDYK